MKKIESLFLILVLSAVWIVGCAATGNTVGETRQPFDSSLSQYEPPPAPGTAGSPIDLKHWTP